MNDRGNFGPDLQPWSEDHSPVDTGSCRRPWERSGGPTSQEGVPVGARRGRINHTAVHLIRGWAAAEWHKNWDETDKGRGVWQFLKRPSRVDPWWKLRRRESATISQFRTGHCPIGAYFSRYRPEVDSRCRNCGEAKETVEHVLSEYPALREYRVDGNGQSFVPSLYGDVSQLRDTAGFILRALRE